MANPNTYEAVEARSIKARKRKPSAKAVRKTMARNAQHTADLMARNARAARVSAPGKITGPVTDKRTMAPRPVKPSATQRPPAATKVPGPVTDKRTMAPRPMPAAPAVQNASPNAAFKRTSVQRAKPILPPHPKPAAVAKPRAVKAAIATKARTAKPRY